MLMSKLQRLRKLAVAKSDAHAAAKSATEYRTREKSLADMVGTLKPTVEALRVYKRRGLTPYEAQDKTAALVKKINESRQQFMADKAWIVNLQGFDYNYLRNSVNGENLRIQAHLKATWSGYLSDHKIRANHQILTLLEKVSAYRNAVRDIKKLDERLSPDKPPMTEAAFQQADEDLRAMKSAWASLKSDELHPDVENFLKALGAKGAPLSAFTPVVMEWLRRENLLDSFTIQVSG
jgi:uncharacterized short protein YbdD (DUF466 family)